ncbi:MAG TPA: PxKF domain-containing protein, partial [Anaeromyxobacteraceae bacterium]|nr:PxKF domain-containing protein [Anaeromyxobacteraceae bacterium]
PATDVTQPLLVKKKAQTITFAALSGKTYGDATFELTATATSGLTVSYAATPGTVCTLTGNMVHVTGAGACTITGSQAGNGNYEAALDAAQSFVIAKKAQHLAFGPLADKTYGDPDFAVTATTDSDSGVPVTFAATGNCTVSGSTVHVTGPGSCVVTASQAGNSNYDAAAAVARSFNSIVSWSNLLPPINLDGSSVFKSGSTVPVKFRLAGASSGLSNVKAFLLAGFVTNAIVGSELEVASTSAADAGNQFRYDGDGQYIFNLSTKALGRTGTWQLRIDLGDGVTHTVLVSLK